MRVVVLRALKLGDFLTAVPAYRALRRAYPAAEIVLAAPRALAPLVELRRRRAGPHRRHRRAGPASRRAARCRRWRSTCTGAARSRTGCCSRRGPRRLIAFRHEAVAASRDGARFDPAEHEVARWCRLLAEAGIPADPSELDLAVPPVLVPRRLRGATLIHPGASSESRRWPVERWTEVARAEQRLGHAVVLTGGPDEVARTRAIADAAGVPSTHVYAGRTSLRELAALVAAAGRVVCGDTGIAHLATAYRRPSVVLFGPVAPAAWGPPERPYHRVLWSGTVGDPHADRVDPGLLAIPAERVIAALDGLPA